MPRLTLDTPVGHITLFEEEGEITALDWGGKSSGLPTALLQEAKKQIHAYFPGKRRVFDLPVRPRGAEIDLQIWQEMAEIPYGETRTYGQIAETLRISPRVVGNACGRNPIPIILPCHRVVGAHGMGGFSAPGGVEWKSQLLLLEGALLL